MKRNYIIHTKQGTQVLTAADIISNAKEQETAGIDPHYAFYDYKSGEEWTAPGWLVWSTYDDGVGVVYRRNDGKYIIVTGWQGEFIYK